MLCVISQRRVPSILLEPFPQRYKMPTRVLFFTFQMILQMLQKPFRLGVPHIGSQVINACFKITSWIMPIWITHVFQGPLDISGSSGTSRIHKCQIGRKKQSACFQVFLVLLLIGLTQLSITVRL